MRKAVVCRRKDIQTNWQVTLRQLWTDIHRQLNWQVTYKMSAGICMEYVSSGLFFFFSTFAVFKCRLAGSVEIEHKGTVPLYPLSPLDILSTPLLPSSKVLFSTWQHMIPVSFIIILLPPASSWNQLTFVHVYMHVWSHILVPRLSGNWGSQ